MPTSPPTKSQGVRAERDVADAVPYGMAKGGQSRPPLRNTSYRSQSGFALPWTPETSPMAANSITSDEPP